MSKRVGIVAVAQTAYEPAHDHWRSHELTYMTVENVLQETGLKFSGDGTGIDATVSSSNWLMEGRGISNLPHSDVAGGHLRCETKVSTEGINAVMLAMIQILARKYDVVLVTACCKESNANQSVIDNFCFEPIFHQKLGLDFLQVAALQQSQYMEKHGISREQCARVVEKNRSNGLKNPNTRFGANVTVDTVMCSNVLAHPITSQEVRPMCDGAATLILATEEKAKKLTDKPVWITGMGQCYDVHFLGERDLADSLALKEASKQAYQMAGIVDPIKDIDAVELSEHYAYQELLWTEALGFCQSGRGGDLIDSGATRIDGQIPVNPSGGVLSGNPRMVAGLTRVVECALQLRQEADKRQVEGAKVALAHGTNGPCGQEQCVLILEKGF
ncbi:thiolase family protein [Chloroflexota bacterium]